MKKVSRLIAITVALVFATESIALAIGSKNAAYFGGTVMAFEGASDPVEGVLDTKNSEQLVFTSVEKKFRGKTFSIPYTRVVDLEYGQKAGRRVGTAVATTVLLGPIGLLSLLSKKRKHYLTVGYQSADGTNQVVVFEIGKDIIRTTLAIVETRSGKKIVYQGDDAQRPEIR